jgi:hypothetical protein
MSCGPSGRRSTDLLVGIVCADGSGDGSDDAAMLLKVTMTPASFRGRAQLSDRLRADLTVDVVRVVPDRPGRDVVFVASRRLADKTVR